MTRKFRLVVGLVTGLATIAALGSCAYYNIYWTASHEYEKATAGLSAAEFWDPFAQKPLTSDAAKNIDSAAKRCGKILLLYPKSKWVDDALVLMGNCFTLKGDYGNALRKYEELLKFYPSSELVDEATYMVAYTRCLDGAVDEALASLEGTEGQIKTKRWREHTIYLAGKIYRHKGDCDGAIEYYDKYLKGFSEGQKAADVTLALADCLIKVGRHSEAAGLLEPLAKKQDLTGSLAAIKLGTAYRKLGEDEKALGTFRGVVEKTLVDSVRARADIETAITLEDQGKPEEAIAALSTADSLGKGTLGGEARYRIGLVYEQRLSDFPKATAAYDEAGKATTEYGKLAAKRASALKAVAKYETILSDSTVTNADTLAMSRFLLGETYLIDLGMAGRAESEFRILSDSLPCSPFTARAKLALGGLLDGRGDSTAQTYYRAVIDSFPTTVYANIARSRLGLPLADVVVAATPAPAPAADTTGAAACAQQVPGMGPPTPETEIPGPPLPEVPGPPLPEAERATPGRVPPEMGPPTPGPESSEIGPPTPRAQASEMGPPTPGPKPSEMGPFAPADTAGMPQERLGPELPQRPPKPPQAPPDTTGARKPVAGEDQ